MSEQAALGLFPLRIASYTPKPWGSADLGDLARTNDGHDFAVKWEHQAQGLPASEWLGYRLAGACQISVPFSAVLTDEHGTLGFGSRIEGTVTQFTRMTATERMEAFFACRQAMSAVLALDLFVGNVDRHADNWLFRRNISGAWAPLCIDFSRALFVRCFPFDAWPMGACNTTSSVAMLKSLGLWDGPYAVFALQQLQQITQSVIKRWLDDCPHAWMDDFHRSCLVDWWGSQQYHLRLQRCFGLL